MKPILILQLRTLDEAADSEFEAFLKYGGMTKEEVHRVRMETESFAHLNPSDYSAVIVGGGPSNVSDTPDEKTDYQLRFEKELDILYEKIFENDIPYLGNCYGLGSLVKYAGGEVSKEKYSEEVGWSDVKFSEDGHKDPLCSEISEKAFKAFVGHKEAVQKVPLGAVLLASSANCLVQMLRFKQNIYATQFHCELDAKGIAERILFYKNHGYFEPNAAEQLIAKTESIIAEIPQVIIHRFIRRYKSS